MSQYRLSSLGESDLDGIWWQLAQEARFTWADRMVDDIVERFGLGPIRPHVPAPPGIARVDYSILIRALMGKIRGVHSGATRSCPVCVIVAQPELLP
jgi:hypothetical protein